MPGVRRNKDTGRFEFGGGQGSGEDDTQRAEKKIASLADGLRLGGLSGPASRRLAIVNNETFAVGESAQVKVLGEMVNLACLEIRTRSAIVQIEGAHEAVEIFLEKGAFLAPRKGRHRAQSAPARRRLPPTRRRAWKSTPRRSRQSALRFPPTLPV